MCWGVNLYLANGWRYQYKRLVFLLQGVKKNFEIFLKIF